MKLQICPNMLDLSNPNNKFRFTGHSFFWRGGDLIKVRERDTLCLYSHFSFSFQSRLMVTVIAAVFISFSDLAD